MRKYRVKHQRAMTSSLVRAMTGRYSKERAARIVNDALAAATLTLQPEWGSRANAYQLLRFGLDARRPHLKVKDLRKDGKYYPVQVPFSEAESLRRAAGNVLSETHYEKPLGFGNRLSEYFRKYFALFMGLHPGKPPRRGAMVLSAKAAYLRPS